MKKKRIPRLRLPGALELCPLHPIPTMTNPMNSYLEYNESQEDPSQPLPAHDASYMTFPNVGNYAFGAMLPQDGDLPPQNFERPDLEGRMSNVMLAYDGIPTSGVSMPMNLDPPDAFAYNVPTTYSAAMGIPPQMDHSQFQSTYPSYPPMSMARYTQPTQHSTQQPLHQPTSQPTQQPGPLDHKELYDTTTDSTANLEESDFSGRTSDRLQVQPRTQRPPPERRLQAVGQPYRPSQPVAIQPKKPVATKGKLYMGGSYLTLEPVDFGACRD